MHPRPSAHLPPGSGPCLKTLLCKVLTCLGVSTLVGDLVDGVQQSLLVAVRVKQELGASVVAELSDGHLS